MRVNSNDLVSRTTQISARNLTAIAATVILVDWYSLDPNRWKLLNGDVTAEVYSGAATVIVGFLSVSLLVHWISDFHLYRKWFKSNEVSMGTLWGMSAPKSTEPPIAGLQRRLDWLLSENDRLDTAISRYFPGMREISVVADFYRAGAVGPGVRM